MKRFLKGIVVLLACYGAYAAVLPFAVPVLQRWEQERIVKQEQAQIAEEALVKEEQVYMDMFQPYQRWKLHDCEVYANIRQRGVASRLESGDLTRGSDAAAWRNEMARLRGLSLTATDPNLRSQYEKELKVLQGKLATANLDTMARVYERVVSDRQNRLNPAHTSYVKWVNETLQHLEAGITNQRNLLEASKQ
jgi:hypothetical protein